MKRLALAAVVFACASSPLLEAQHEIVLPKRRPAGQMPAALPPIAADAEQIEPATLEIVGPGQARQVLRTVDRILVIAAGREWLFERNVLDHRRVSAAIVEHAEKAIVLYAESDVRNLLGLNGWASVLASTSEASFSTDGTSKVKNVRAGVDEHLLRACQLRFPTYKVFEVADWLERK